MEIFDLVRQAIEGRLQVTAVYRDGRREMCPHVLGWNRHGRPQALFYQFGGGSSSGLGADGSPDNWRCIPIDGLTDAATREGDWHTSPRHTQIQTCVAKIEVEIDY